MLTERRQCGTDKGGYAPTSRPAVLTDNTGIEQYCLDPHTKSIGATSHFLLMRGTQKATYRRETQTTLSFIETLNSDRSNFYQGPRWQRDRLVIT